MKYRDSDPSEFAVMATTIPPDLITPGPVSSLSGESKGLLAPKSLPDDYRVYHRKTSVSFDVEARVEEPFRA